MSTPIYSTGNHVLVGLGGTGGKILRAFKMRMFEEFPDAEERKSHPVTILYVDTTDEMMPKNGRARADFKVMGLDASFTNSEFLNIKAVDVNHVLDHINNFPTVKGIVDNVQAVRTAIGSLGEAAGQKRRAGRLLFAANANAYVNALKNAYAKVEQTSGDATETTFHIFAGLAGGTGSGSIIDSIIQTRKAFPKAKILVYAMIPEMHLPKANMDQGRYYPNGYAAVMELNALQTGRWTPQDVTGYGRAKFFNTVVKGVADGIAFYSNVNENGVRVDSFEELPKIVSDYVFSRIFLVNPENKAYEDIIRSYKFENIDNYALEYDETANRDASGRIPVARTKKLNSFGIKRVIYPELRVLKHITYTVGESVLWQFKYNNWRDEQGYIEEEANRDLRQEYLSKESGNIPKWKLDLEHLTLESKILPSEPDEDNFKTYWKKRVEDRSEQAKETDTPLAEIDRLMGRVFDDIFREDGVVKYYQRKEKVIPEYTKQLRSNIEKEIFEKWKDGDFSITELQKLSKLLIEHIGELKEKVQEEIKKEKGNLKAIDEEREANVEEWTHLGILQRMVNKGARLYEDHKMIIQDYYECKTRIVALEFAQKLVSKLFNEIGRMDADISQFAAIINEAIEQTEKRISEQQKVNRGLEDMKGALIEVSEEEQMQIFEVELMRDKSEMPGIAQQLRENILKDLTFTNFGQLAQDITTEQLSDAFDTQLSVIVRQKHDKKIEADKKVLGLNILTQLQQKLRTDDDIKAFATKLVRQSGVFLSLNGTELTKHLRNNEGDLSPSNVGSINNKTILVSIPSPEGNDSLKKFASKLEEAITNSISQEKGQLTVNVATDSPRTDELSVLTVNYCFPVRAIDWLQTYKDKYEYYINSGNPATDENNKILLHGEGNGEDLPSVFAVENAEEIAREAASAEAARQAAAQPAAPAQPASQMSSAMPPMPGAVPPPMPGAVLPPIPQQPEISAYLSVAGQQYGPFNYEQCSQMVKTGQISASTMVWMEGMPAWQEASKVEKMKGLFAPAMPPMPGTTPGMPPMPPAL